MKQQLSAGIRSVTALALLGFAPSAFAYLDPSTGSMILSAIVGVFATLMLAVKTYWYKLKAFFSGRSVQPDMEGQSDTGVSSEDSEAA